MKIRFKQILLFIIISPLFFCSNSKEADLKTEFQEKQILYGVLSTTNFSSSSGCPKPSITCSGSNNINSFTNLKSVINTAYGTKGDCARSGCHNGSAQFDLNNYSTTINFVVE